MQKIYQILLSIAVVGFTATVMWGMLAAAGHPVQEKVQNQITEFKVTPVTGPSWIKRLGLNVANTRLGQMGGTMPPPDVQQPELATAISSGRHGMGYMNRILNRIFSLFREDQRSVENLMQETFELSGADLYRLNCQSCHGPDGEGAPPEIRSLIDPVRGTSPKLVKERMAKIGREIDDEFARELAKSAEESLLERLKNGGEKMPPFRHLAGKEIEALMHHLKKLAGVPEAGGEELYVTQSVARVGEHLAKGTCQICHDATGPGPGHMTMMRGLIPALGSFPKQLSIQQVVRQVKMGSMGMMRMMHGLSMPAYPYLTENEVAALYLYLMSYPPEK